ncbi:MAG: hypothetical protein K2Q24_14955 [Chitinophagaceae bacterium]|jgi:hypothetical protein|nr:hypothetical protein [Chitinophagaceae bacterium]
MATTAANNNSFWGMIIYEIKGDGTLYGTWKNNQLSNDSILGEIARKNDNNPDIEGLYTVSWIEENNQPQVGTLTINLIENNTALSFEWQDSNNQEVFRGMGMPIGLDRIAVTYWNTVQALQLSF